MSRKPDPSLVKKLAAARIPEGQGVENCSGAEGRDERIDLRDLDKDAVDQAAKKAAGQYD